MMWKGSRRQGIQQGLAMIGLLLMATSAYAPALTGESSTDLAKKSQNPVADLISIPLQNNMNFGIGPNNRMQNVLNVQPVIPINLNSEWNLITRTIMPIIKQPNLATTSDDTWGLGDTNVSAFLSPADSKPIIWGLAAPRSIFQHSAIGPAVRPVLWADPDRAAS